jgi:DNA-binding PadR family transcriptional regulator
MLNNLVSSKKDIVSVNLKGQEITLKNVPVEINKKRKITHIFFEDLMKAEQEFNAQENNLQPIEIPDILLMYAETQFIKGGYINQKSRFNKMLFYFWKDMEKENLGNSYVFDEFVSCRAGPVPKNLKSSLNDLEKKGVIEAKWSKKPGVSSEFTLTKKGFEIAKSLWENTPDTIKNIIIKVKKDIFLIDATQLKEKVHREYPEYRRTYTELDQE